MVKTLGSILEKLGKTNLPHKFEKCSPNNDVDTIVITSNYDEDLYDSFEDIAFRNYKNGQPSTLWADKAYQEVIENSDKLNEDVVNFFEFQNGAPGPQISQLLSRSNEARHLIIASGEYLKEFDVDIRPNLEPLDDEFIGLYK